MITGFQPPLFFPNISSSPKKNVKIFFIFFFACSKSKPEEIYKKKLSLSVRFGWRRATRPHPDMRSKQNVAAVTMRFADINIIKITPLDISWDSDHSVHKFNSKCFDQNTHTH